MYSRFVFSFVISICAIGLIVAVPTSPVEFQCGPNADFHPCGTRCPPTCNNPIPNGKCTRDCAIGCFCREGFLKDEQGDCVHESCAKRAPETKPMPEPFPIEIKPMPEPIETKTTKEPLVLPTDPLPIIIEPPMSINMMQDSDPTCSENEEYRRCKGCDGTCENPDPICHMGCSPGCACKEGHVRDINYRCISRKQCKQPEFHILPIEEPIETKTTKEPLPLATGPLPINPGTFDIASTCSDNEEYRRCKGCDGTCENPDPICHMGCSPGCACKEGHVRDTNYRCIPRKQCKQPEFHILPIEESKCGPNEIFRACGTACPPTCDDRHPSPWCTKDCVPGCHCVEGHLRHSSGACVPAANCGDSIRTIEVLLRGAPRRIPLRVPVPTECSSDREIYSECGTVQDCLASCSSPIAYLLRGVPQIPSKCRALECKSACACKHPYYRHQNGQCVERSECHKTQ